jgi:hypothetical protein
VLGFGAGDVFGFVATASGFEATSAAATASAFGYFGVSSRAM